MALNDYPSAQRVEIITNRRRLNMTGHPEKVLILDKAIEEGQPYEYLETIFRDRKVQPSKPITKPVYEPPAKNASTLVWRKFALEVSEMESEIVEAMSRTDIIRVLTDMGIITE